GPRFRAASASDALCQTPRGPATKAGTSLAPSLWDMRSIAPFALVALLAAPSAAFATPTAQRAAERGHNFSRSLRTFVKTYRDSREVVLPEHAKDYRYVLVKGVIAGLYPRYMARD